MEGPHIIINLGGAKPVNQLSQLLYWGNVSGNLGPLFAIFGIIVAVIVVIIVIINVTVADDMSSYPFTKKVKDFKLCRRITFFFTPLVFIFWIMAALCPSQETVYAIAASEVGGKMITSPTGDLATQALNSWLKRQINPPSESH